MKDLKRYMPRMKDNDVNGNHIHHMVTSSGQNIHEEQVNFDRHQITAQQQDFSIKICQKYYMLL